MHRTAKKCTKFLNARAELLFCRLGLLFFHVLVAVAPEPKYKVFQRTCWAIVLPIRSFVFPSPRCRRNRVETPVPVLLCHFTRGVDRSFHHPTYISPGISKLRAQSRMLFCACYHCFPCAYVMVRFDPAIQLVAQTKSCTLYVRTYSHTLPNFSAGLVTTIFVNMGLRCVHFAWALLLCSGSYEIPQQSSWQTFGPLGLVRKVTLSDMGWSDLISETARTAVICSYTIRFSFRVVALYNFKHLPKL